MSKRSEWWPMEDLNQDTQFTHILPTSNHPSLLLKIQSFNYKCPKGLHHTIHHYTNNLIHKILNNFINNHTTHNNNNFVLKLLNNKFVLQEHNFLLYPCCMHICFPFYLQRTLFRLGRLLVCQMSYLLGTIPTAPLLSIKGNRGMMSNIAIPLRAKSRN